MIAFLAAYVLATLIHITGFVVTARAFGVHPMVFSLFMGPPLISFNLRGIQFQLCLIPLGAYVKFPDYDTPDGAIKGRRRMCELHHFQRVAIVLSGCTALALTCTLLLGLEGFILALRSAFSSYLRGVINPINYGAPLLREFIFSTESFAQKLGVVAAAFCGLNLLPIPLLNGGEAILTVLRWNRLGQTEWDVRFQWIGLMTVMIFIGSWTVALIKALFG